MTSHYSHEARVLTLDCDEPGCRANHEGAPGTFGDAWRGARDEGWVYAPRYEGNISVARHFCLRHAASRGEAR